MITDQNNRSRVNYGNSVNNGSITNISTVSTSEEFYFKETQEFEYEDKEINYHENENINKIKNDIMNSEDKDINFIDICDKLEEE